MYAHLHRMSNSFIKIDKGVFKDFGSISPHKITIVMKYNYTVLFTQTNFYKNEKIFESSLTVSAIFLFDPHLTETNSF